MLSAAVGIVFVLSVAILATLAIHRLRSGLSHYADYGDWFGDDDAAAGVREPRRPPPTSGAATALAEPDEDARSAIS
jgi:hypothetical protein